MIEVRHLSRRKILRRSQPWGPVSGLECSRSTGNSSTMPGIRTAYRCKIGSHIVYPMRLAEVQSSLESASTLFDIAVKFFDYKAPKQGEDRACYSIAEISYTPDDPNQREVMLQPVPKNLHSEVNAKLKVLLEQKVTHWLLEKRQPGWEQKYHALRISYDTARKDCAIAEFNAA